MDATQTRHDTIARTAPEDRSGRQIARTAINALRGNTSLPDSDFLPLGMRPPVLLGQLCRQDIRPRDARQAVKQLVADGDVLRWTDADGDERLTPSDPARLVGLLDGETPVDADRLRELQGRLAGRDDPPRGLIGQINGVLAGE